MLGNRVLCNRVKGEVKSKYDADFPVVQEKSEPARQVHSGMEVINRVEITSEDDYKAALAEHNARASRHEEDRVKEGPISQRLFTL